MPHGARIKWMFTTEKARAKMGRAYPNLSSVKEFIITVQRELAALVKVERDSRPMGGRLCFASLQGRVSSSFRDLTGDYGI